VTLFIPLAVAPKNVSLRFFSGVARIFDAKRGKKLRENNLRVTHKNIMYYEIHAINSDKTIGLYILSG